MSDPEEPGASARVWLDETRTLVGLAMARSIGDLAVKRVSYCSGYRLIRSYFVGVTAAHGRVVAVLFLPRSVAVFRCRRNILCGRVCVLSYNPCLIHYAMNKRQRAQQ